MKNIPNGGPVLTLTTRHVCVYNEIIKVLTPRAKEDQGNNQDIDRRIMSSFHIPWN